MRGKIIGQLPRLGLLVLLIWALQAHGIEVQTQTIQLGEEQNILFMPFIAGGDSHRSRRLHLRNRDGDRRGLWCRDTLA